MGLVHFQIFPEGGKMLCDGGIYDKITPVVLNDNVTRPSKGEKISELVQV